MEAFLEAILPRSGIYFAALLRQDKFTHYSRNSIAELAAFIAEADKSGHTVYHACAAYQRESYTEWSDKYQKDITRYRTHENVRALRSFYLDLDVDPEDVRKYPSKEEALGAVLAFCKINTFPAPTIVDSGGGIHCYWPFDEEMLRFTWEPLAEAFKQTLLASGLKIDPAVPADAARVLRTPGTHNKKRGAAVRLIGKIRTCTTHQIVAALTALTKKFKIVPDILKQSARKFEPSKVTDLFAHETYPPSHIAGVASRCGVVSHMAQTSGDVSEPVWYGVLGLMAHAVDGEALIHKWSSGHRSYSEQETAAKFAQWKDGGVGPATCGYFRSKGDPHCALCPHWEKIRTPLQLGVVLAPAANADEAGKEIVPPPFPFDRAADGIYYTIDKAANIKQRIFSSDIYISDIMQHQAGYEVAVFNYNRPHMGWQQFHERTATFTKLDSAWNFFCDNGIYLSSKGDADIMTLYCRSYLDELHRRRAALATFTNMGWKDDAFLVGSIIVSETSFQTNPTIKQVIPIADYFTPRGDVRKWVEVTKVFAERDLHTHGFALLAGFAAPIYKFTGLGGATVNLVGKTGLGKSSLQRMICSIFGNPEKLMLKANDTQNSLIKRISTLNNLPVCVDEMGNITKERASNMLLQMSQGMDKLSLTQSRDERPANEWATILTCSSNHSLILKLADMKYDYDAEVMRLLEIKVTPSRLFADVAKGKWFNRTIMENYGKVGLVYLKALVQQRATIQQQIDEASAELAHAGMVFSAQERYWSGVFACCYAAGKIARGLGLILFDPMPCMQAVYSTLMSYKEETTDAKLDAFQVIGRFISEHYGSLIVVDVSHKDVSILSAPIGRDIVGRIERNSRNHTLNCALGISTLRSWLSKKFLSLNEIKDELLFSTAVVNESSRVQFGKGTHFQLPATKSIIFDLCDPNFQISLETLEASKEETENG